MCHILLTAVFKFNRPAVRESHRDWITFVVVGVLNVPDVAVCELNSGGIINAHA